MTETPAATWQPIDSAPHDTPILAFTRSWGVIVAVFSGEHGEWLSRMQVPVSIREDDELPTHWQPLPAPPDGLGQDDAASAPSP